MKTVTRTDTVAQSGASNVSADGAAITGEPFAFAKVGKLRRIERLTITATLGDAETAPGDSAENLLDLALDGIDTGLALNGFRSNEVDTLTLTGAPTNPAEILAALKSDGQLAATIVMPAGPSGNLVSVPADFDTALALKGKQKRKKR